MIISWITGHGLALVGALILVWCLVDHIKGGD